METVASLWPGDLGGRRQESRVMSAPLTWTEPLEHLEPLEPHLHRHKQLQDRLQQKEEELQQLQDENQELRRFLSSASIRDLQHKVQTVDGTKLKRSLEDRRPRRPLLVSKRVCRNLTGRLDSLDPDPDPDPDLDLDRWVLRTLGLKDRDTIDPSSQSPDLGLRALVYHTLSPSSSPGQTLSSAHSSSLSSALSSTLSSTLSSALSSPLSSAHSSSLSSTLSSPLSSTLSSTFSSTPRSPLSSAHSSTLSSAHSLCPRGTPGPAGPHCRLQTCAAPPGGRSTMGPDGPRGTVRTPPCTLHPDLAHLCTAAAPPYWSLSRDSAHFRPPAETLPVSPPWSPCSWTSPPAAVSTPRGRTDVAFRVSLSPSSSVKTHSFPQGQAFTCRHLDGRWDFTWVPRQEP